jgi:hypothetical protein
MCGMRKIPLSKSNPYLRDREKAREYLIRSVASSTAIETGRSVEVEEKALRKELAGWHLKRGRSTAR